MSVDLATHAAANVSAHGAAADAVVGQYPNARDFRLAAAVAPMSTNVSADKMVAYASAGMWLSTFEFVTSQQSDDPSKVDAAYLDAQNRAGPNVISLNWGDRREAFESEIDARRTARYAALNLGNAGISNYGLFCLVAEPSEVDGLFVVPANSLDQYVTSPTAPKVDVDRLTVEVATWRSRGDVATIKHGPKIDSEPTSWPDLICDSTAEPPVFIEVIVVPPTGESVPMSWFSETRLPAEDLDRITMNLARRSHAIRSGAVLRLDPVEQVELEAFQWIVGMDVTLRGVS